MNNILSHSGAISTPEIMAVQGGYMHVLIVIYELHKEPNSQDYKNVLSIIKSYDCLKVGGSEYCIYTNDSPQTVSDKLIPYFDSNDRLLVITATNPKQGWLSEDQWKWLNERLQ